MQIVVSRVSILLQIVSVRLISRVSFLLQIVVSRVSILLQIVSVRFILRVSILLQIVSVRFVSRCLFYCRL